MLYHHTGHLQVKNGPLFEKCFVKIFNIEIAYYGINCSLSFHKMEQDDILQMKCWYILQTCVSMVR